MLDLIAKHRSRGILIDTNIFLLELVGVVEPRILMNRSFKRTEKFSIADFHKLEMLLRRFELNITTPNVLTETSNLLGQLTDPARTRVFTAFARLMCAMKERHVDGGRLGRESIFVKLGLTDSGLLVAARKGYLILMDDFPLYNHLIKEGYDAINFSHVRAS